MVIPNGGITFAEGESWARQRKFVKEREKRGMDEFHCRASVAILKQFGMGGGFMENQVN